MNLPVKRCGLAAALVFAGASALISGCGGGGGDGSTAASTDTYIEGTAAYGAALVSGKITVRRATGASVCANDPVSTSATGTYSCRLIAAATGPFVIVVSDPDGLVSPMVSILATTPATGSRGTANVTPLTTAIAAQLDSGKDPFAIDKDPSLLSAVSSVTLNAIKANVVRQLAPVLTDAGVDATTFDPVTTAFTGGNHSGVDKMLDQIRVNFENGAPVLSNALDPATAPVPMADATTVTPPTVLKSPLVTPFTPSELDFVKNVFAACFAVPSAQRVTLDGSGNVSATATACHGIVADDLTLIPAVHFMHNGKNAGVFFKNLLTDANMDGAKFNAPEILRYGVKTDGRDEVVINTKYTDKNGIAGNVITVAKKFPGTDTGGRGSAWWLYGNQRPIDATIQASIRQREQMIPASVLAASSTFDNAARSRYETGLNIYIGRDTAQPSGVTLGMRYVRVKGPGLPDAGLVYADVAPSQPQTWMGFLNTTGTIPSGTQQYAINAGNIFLLQRTQGISGTSTFAIRPNPGVGGAQPAGQVNWAHPDMYAGEVRNANWAFDITKVPAWSQYSFEVFRNAESTPSTTFTASIVTPMVPATYGGTQPWHSYTSATRALVSDGAAATGSLTIAWTANPLAERVSSVNAYSSAVNSPSTGVAKGVFSQTVSSSPSSTLFPALSNSSNATSRQLQLRYNILDGSYKDQMIQFN